jgi:hypothetical protein
VKTKDKSGTGRMEKPVDQLPLDFPPPKPQPKADRTAEIVPISKQRTATVRDVLVSDLIASKVPKKS